MPGHTFLGAWVIFPSSFQCYKLKERIENLRVRMGLGMRLVKFTVDKLTYSPWFERSNCQSLIVIRQNQKHLSLLDLQTEPLQILM